MLPLQKNGTLHTRLSITTEGLRLLPQRIPTSGFNRRSRRLHSYMDTNEDDMRSIPPPDIKPQSTIASLKAQIDALSLTENDSLIKIMGANQDFTPA
jgi:hypothetical protein